MSLVAVQRPGAQISVSGEALRVELRGEVLTTKPLHEITELQLHGATSLTRTARNLLLRRGIDVVFFAGNGRYLGRLTGPMSKAGRRRLAQARHLAQDDCIVALARTLVDGKLEHQRHFTVRLNRRRPAPQLAAATVSLRRLRSRLPETSTLDGLRGLEGQGAALYFRGLDAAVLTEGFHFARRTRRPPLDPFNACLSFGYTLLLIRVETAILKAGLDPYMGALHSALRSAPALALDLMEPFRPFVDRLVLRLVNRRQLDPADFVNPNLKDTDRGRPPIINAAEASPSPAVHLGPIGREVFLRTFAAEWRTPMRYEPADRALPLGEIIQRQAFELSRFFEGEAEGFRPFVPR